MKKIKIRGKRGELGIKEIVIAMLALIIAFFVIYLAVKTLEVLG